MPDPAAEPPLTCAPLSIAPEFTMMLPAADTTAPPANPPEDSIMLAPELIVVPIAEPATFKKPNADKVAPEATPPDATARKI